MSLFCIMITCVLFTLLLYALQTTKMGREYLVPQKVKA